MSHSFTSWRGEGRCWVMNMGEFWSSWMWKLIKPDNLTLMSLDMLKHFLFAFRCNNLGWQTWNGWKITRPLGAPLGIFQYWINMWTLLCNVCIARFPSTYCEQTSRSEADQLRYVNHQLFSQSNFSGWARRKLGPWMISALVFKTRCFSNVSPVIII